MLPILATSTRLGSEPRSLAFRMALVPALRVQTDARLGLRGEPRSWGPFGPQMAAIWSYPREPI